MPVTQVTKTLSVLIMLELYNQLTEVAHATERVNPPCANSVKTHWSPYGIHGTVRVNIIPEIAN